MRTDRDGALSLSLRGLIGEFALRLFALMPSQIEEMHGAQRYEHDCMTRSQSNPSPDHRLISNVYCN